MTQASPKCFVLRACAALLLLANASVACATGLTFNTTIGPGLTALAGTNPALAANIQAGFTQAQSIWSSTVSDPIEINLVLDWELLEQGTLASANSVDSLFAYSQVRAALEADRKSVNDFTAVANLPAGSYFTGLTNDRDGTKYFNNTETTAGTLMFFNRATAKALGLIAGNNTTLDATIRFSSRYSWDFSHTPTPGKNDFVGVALHEIGHALGFTSGVSAVDQYTGDGPNANVDLNGPEPGLGNGSNLPVFTVLDLYRHSAESNALGSTVLDLATGGTPFLQIDGMTPLGNFSTGEYNGDGRQPSHWKHNTPAIMKPSYAAGTIQDLTDLDLIAFDVIGYDLMIVPEPPALILALVAGVGLLIGKRRRRGPVSAR